VNKSLNQKTASTEDYLEMIYELSIQDKNFKSVDIANKMNISRASVSEALKKLSDKGYIIYEKYKQAQLTEKGLEVAKTIYEKHQVLCSFFKKYLNLSEEEASINACRIEHVITENAFIKIKKIMKNI